MLDQRDQQHDVELVAKAQAVFFDVVSDKLAARILRARPTQSVLVDIGADVAPKGGVWEPERCRIMATDLEDVATNERLDHRSALAANQWCKQRCHGPDVWRA